MNTSSSLIFYITHGALPESPEHYSFNYEVWKLEILDLI